MGSLNIFFVDDNHLVCEKVSLLKSPHSGRPVIRSEAVGKVEPEYFLHSAPGACEALKMDIGCFAVADAAREWSIQLGEPAVIPAVLTPKRTIIYIQLGPGDGA